MAQDLHKPHANPAQANNNYISPLAMASSLALTLGFILSATVFLLLVLKFWIHSSRTSSIS